MNRKSIKNTLAKGLSLIFIAVFMAGVIAGLGPVQMAKAVILPPILDQSFISPTDLGLAINSWSIYVAQTFIPSLDGPLYGIKLDITSSSKYPLHVAIRGVENGMPDSVILGETTLSRGSASLSQMITFPATIKLFANTPYAIVVNYLGAPPPGNNTWQGLWNGSTNNPYAGGGAYDSFDGLSWRPADGGYFDLHFQTYANMTIYNSDLAIKLDSAPKYVKACETFKLTYTITNHGPDFAKNVNVEVIPMDQYDVISQRGVPRNLAVGQSATVAAMIKVVAFVPGASRKGTISATISSDSIDPNPDNNTAGPTITITGDHATSCP